MIKLIYKLIGPHSAHSNTMPITEETAKSICYNSPLNTGGNTLYQVPYLFNILSPTGEFVPTHVRHLKEDEPFIYELPWNINKYIDDIFPDTPAEILDGIRSGHGYFLINDAVDPAKNHRIEEVLAGMDRNNIPRNKIIWLTGDIDTEYFNNVYGINMVVSDWNEIVVSEAVLTNEEFDKNNPKDKPKNNRFISLNRMWHQHRMMLLYNIVKRGLTRHFDISFLKTEINTNKTFTDYFLDFAGSRLTAEELAEVDTYLPEIEKLLPLVVDIDASGGGAHAYNVIHSQYYFNIVPETTFFNIHNEDLCTHASEKIFKPIMYKSPFILFGPPHVLSALRKRGYGTFGKYIDESYDDERDDAKRFKKVMDVIETISKMDQQSLDKMYADMYPICLHNYEVLKTRSSIALNQLVNNLKGIVCNGQPLIGK